MNTTDHDKIAMLEFSTQELIKNQKHIKNALLMIVDLLEDIKQQGVKGL